MLVPPTVPLAVELRVKPFKVKSWVKRLVEEAVVEKRLVVVAFVVVELPFTSRLPVILKLESMVELAVERKPCRKPRVVEVETP